MLFGMRLESLTYYLCNHFQTKFYGFLHWNVVFRTIEIFHQFVAIHWNPAKTVFRARPSDVWNHEGALLPRRLHSSLQCCPLRSISFAERWIYPCDIRDYGTRQRHDLIVLKAQILIFVFPPSDCLPSITLSPNMASLLRLLCSRS